MPDPVYRGHFLSSLLQERPAIWRWGRAIRAAFCIGAPFAVGLMTGDIMTGMWVAMGCLMMVTAESSIPYREVYRTILISAPIGALGYLAGYLSPLPWGFIVFAMMLAGLASGLLSSAGHALSLGALQFLLLASIALGVPSIGSFWQPAALYLAGAAFYALVLGVEVLVRGWHAQDVQMAAGVTSSRHAPPNDRTQLAQALALALCLGAAYSAHWFDRSPHWFWIPLTVGLVMKPDLGPIRDRSFQRIIGTVGGVAIGAIILSLVPKGNFFVLIMALLAGVLPWAMQRSYVLQAVFLTPLILMLVDVIIPGSRDVDFALQRLLDTAIGSAIVVLIGYLPLQAYHASANGSAVSKAP